MTARPTELLPTEERVRAHLEAIGRIGVHDGIPDGRDWRSLQKRTPCTPMPATFFAAWDAGVFKDEFCNLFGLLEGQPNPGSLRVMLGTHLDTVESGGNYDGVVGFIVAVETVRELLHSALPRPDIHLAVFRSEESTLFEDACLGSRAAFLGLDQETLSGRHRDLCGGVISLVDAVGATGGAPAVLGKPTLDAPLFQAYFETHIEQARVLERAIGLDCVGDGADPAPILVIVTSIRAPQRCDWEISGQDCISLFAKCVIAVEASALLANRLGLDAVATVGRVAGFVMGPDQINAVPGRVEFPVRSLTQDLRDRGREIGQSRQCVIEIENAEYCERIRVIGRTDHSGGAPMGLANRRDALVAACEIVLGLPPTVFVPCERILFNTDVRSNSAKVRGLVFDLIRKTFDAFHSLQSTGESAASVQLIRRTDRTKPISSLSSELQERIASAASDERIDTMYLPSGAGHDAMIAAIAGIPTAMIFIPSLAGVSHSPSEYSRIKDIAAAVKVQRRVLERMI